MTSRRAFLIGGVATLAAPAIVRAESLMKIVVPKRDPCIDLASLGLRRAEFIEKMVRPPMFADVTLRNLPATILPGHISYIETHELIAMSAFSPCIRNWRA